MKSTLLFLAFVGIVLCAPAPEDVEINLRAPSTFQNCECQCDSYTWSSKGKTLGNCLSADASGGVFCYISGRALQACRDVKVSESRTNSFSRQGKHYSYEACATPPRSQCFNRGGIGSNFGDGDLVGRPGSVGAVPLPAGPIARPPLGSGGHY